MAQSVIKTIYLGDIGSGVDISDYISSFKYRRGIDRDNVLDMTAQGTSADFLLTLKDFYPNKPVTFNYGYITGEVSPTHLVVISDIEPTWSGDGLTLRIRCLDKGSTMKKVTSTRVWKGKDTAAIVNEVAQLHGLKTEITPVDSAISGSPAGFRYYESLPQGNMNDMELVQQLTKKENGTEYVSYVNNDTLYFKPIGLDTPSRKTFDILDTDKVIRFGIKHRETTSAGEIGIGKVNAVTGKSESTKQNVKTLAALKGFSFLGQSALIVENGIAYNKKGGDNVPIRSVGKIIDAVTGALKGEAFDLSPIIGMPIGGNVTKVNPIKGTSDGESEAGVEPSGVLAGVQDFVGSIGSLSDNLNDDYTMGENKVAPSSMPATESSSRARHRHSRNSRKVLTATLTLYGSPTEILDSVITITGISERYIGNWYVESIEDSMGGDYTTTIELTKNAVQVSKNGVTPQKINNTVGKSNTVVDKKTVHIAATDGTIYNDTNVLIKGTPPKGTVGTRND